jgi:hypothetical protein
VERDLLAALRERGLRVSFVHILLAEPLSLRPRCAICHTHLTRLYSQMIPLAPKKTQQQCLGEFPLV